MCPKKCSPSKSVSCLRMRIRHCFALEIDTPRTCQLVPSPHRAGICLFYYEIPLVFALLLCMMAVTRRANGALKSDDSSAATPSKGTTKASTPPPPTHSPFLPTRTEALLLFIFPLTLLLGSLFSHLSPTLRPPWTYAIYSPEEQSYQPSSAAPSYFAMKKNVFNVYFVKIGWFWCTLALAFFTLFVSQGSLATDTSPTTNATTLRTEADDRVRRRWQTLFRYLTATSLWVLVTQWFFGPALIDRSFKLTGGICQLANEELAKADTKRQANVAMAVSHAACKMAGGRWRGGHDISGHVFLLVLGSGMLWMEMLPYLFKEIKGLGIGRVVRRHDGQDTRVANELGIFTTVSRDIRETVHDAFDSARDLDPRNWANRPGREEITLKAYATTMGLFVAVLSWWMLLMTSAFFHTWLEKSTGFLLAFAGLWTVYYLPRGLAQVRDVLGMPGV